MRTEITEGALAGTGIEIAEGRWLELDGWRYGGTLEPAGVYEMLGIMAPTVTEVQGRRVVLPFERVEVTGRGVRWGHALGGRIRIRVTFWAEEGEEATRAGGWMWV